MHPWFAADHEGRLAANLGIGQMTESECQAVRSRLVRCALCGAEHPIYAMQQTGAGALVCRPERKA